MDKDVVGAVDVDVLIRAAMHYAIHNHWGANIVLSSKMVFVHSVSELKTRFLVQCCLSIVVARL